MMQLKVVDPENTLAQQIIAEHLKLLQNNQLKEVARVVNRPVELVKRAVDSHQAPRSKARPALQQDRTAARRTGRSIPQSGWRVASIHERRRPAAASSKPHLPPPSRAQMPPIATSAIT